MKLRIISKPNHSQFSNSQNNKAQPKFLSDEWFVLNFLKEWTPQDIQLAIDNNVDLAKLLSDYQGTDAVGMLTGITGKYEVSTDDRVNVENVLQWFLGNRPDLYRAIIEHKDGLKWLTENMNQLKKIL